MKNFILYAFSFVILLTLIILITFSTFTSYSFPHILPSKFSFKYFNSAIFHNKLFVIGIKNSLIIALLAAILSISLGLITSIALANYNFSWKSYFKLFCALPLFIPSTCLYLCIHSMMLRINLVNTYMGVALAHCIITLPYSINILLGALYNFDFSLRDVAKTLGSKNFYFYRKILFPIIKNSIYMCFSISFILSFSEYYSTFLIGGGNIITLPINLFPYIFNGDFNNASVLGIVFMSINLLLFIIVNNFSNKNHREEVNLYES